MSEQPVITLEPHNEIILTSVQCERLDGELTAELQTEVSIAAQVNTRLPVVLDMSKVEFFPSLSLGILVKLLGEFKKRGQRFILVGIQQPIRGALALTRLDKLFEIYDTVDEALVRIRAGAPPAD